jgi:hypothetical protein
MNRREAWHGGVSASLGVGFSKAPLHPVVKANGGTNMEASMPKKVEFSCREPRANSVFVAGTFNGSKPDAAPLLKSGGQWTGELPLPPGRHEYKFVIDGQWCCEAGCEHAYQGCSKCVPNEFGTMNRVLEVG